ncbi:MAG: type II toxin-antitoxin system PemK/MazF family toxin [Duganella sp.]
MTPAGWIPERSEIIYIQHRPHAGDEMPGVHPLLVVSTRQFNEKTGIVIGFPMTHAARHKTNPFAVAVGRRRKSSQVSRKEMVVEYAATRWTNDVHMQNRMS